RGPALTGSVELLEPVSVEIPALLALPVRTDTVYVDRVMYTREVVDTAAIIADYELKRSYAPVLFDDVYGRLALSLSVQYNRVSALSYEFTPVVKTVYRERVWQPFALLQYGAPGGAGVGGGMFYRRMGYYVMYATDLQRHGFGAGVMVRF
ncbi:MAG: hypothetical protein LBF85_01290, partial [Tannerella sp.]|nr:hypothetical protein [Tannerella sp.]